MEPNNEPKKPQNSGSARLTTKFGCPIGDKLASLQLGSLGPTLMADVAYIEETAHFNRERIPERVVHAKGAAAYGEFVVTDPDEISRYTKASLFATKGLKTPVAARFSHVTGESGISDSTRDFRGFAVKFYTQTGNWDLVGNNFPVFFMSDPINFVSFVHSQKRDPKTHLRDPDAFWDFVSLMPESLHAIIMLFSERGIPENFRQMHGYGVNTFKLVNSKGEAFFAKFHWICQQKIKNLDQADADRLAGKDPDHYLRDLQISIEKREFPMWKLKFQVMSLEQASQSTFNPFDVTKTWPQADYPLMEIGQMTLNSNVQNYFAQTEQLAFSPANMIPGIEPSPDKILVGRMLAYPDSQRYRLGANYAELPCNQPKCPILTPTYCDGSGFVGILNPTSKSNYVPTIKDEKLAKLKIRDESFLEHNQQFTGEIGRYNWAVKSSQYNVDHYQQVKIFVKQVLSEKGRAKLAQNIAEHIKQVKNKEILKRMMKHFALIDSQLCKNIETFRQAH